MKRNYVNIERAKQFQMLTFYCNIISLIIFAIAIFMNEPTIALYFGVVAIMSHNDMRYWDIVEKIHRGNKK